MNNGPAAFAVVLKFTTGGSGRGLAVVAKVVGHTWGRAAVLIAASIAAFEVGRAYVAVCPAKALIASIGTGPRITRRICLVSLCAGYGVIGVGSAANEG